MLELALRVGFSLCVVLGLIWGAARLGQRRLGGGGNRALLRVRGRQSLSRTTSLAVVEVGTRVLVVGVSDGSVRLLTELDPEEIEDPEASAPGPDGTTSARPGVVRALAGLVAGAPSRPAADPATGSATGGVTGGLTGSAAEPATGTALAGSLLTAQTWKQAWAAATKRSQTLPHTPEASLVETGTGTENA